MNENRWPLLMNCADFQEVYDYIFNKYMEEDCFSILDDIENEIETYENSSEEEWQKNINNENIPASVQWYCGIINTKYFLTEFF